MEKLRKFIITKLLIRKLGSSSVLVMHITISNDEDPSLRIESFAMTNLRGVCTKLYFNPVFNIHVYQEPITNFVMLLYINLNIV